jgi:hypothetical protein
MRALVMYRYGKVGGLLNNQLFEQESAVDAGWY